MRVGRLLLGILASAVWLAVVLGLDYDSHQTRDIWIAAGASVTLGFAIGRWDALALPLIVATAATLWYGTTGYDPESEIPVEGAVAIFFAMAAALDVCLAIGVALRRAAARRRTPAAG